MCGRSRKPPRLVGYCQFEGAGKQPRVKTVKRTGPRCRSVEALLASYPRIKPDLPPRQKAIYESHIVASRTGESRLLRAVNWVEGWMHRTVASASAPGQTVLELGAGTLNHIPYEPDTVYDAVEPMGALIAQSQLRDRLRALYGSIDAVPSANRYDRIFSIAVLEHLEELPRIVAKSAGLLKPGGLFQAAIPSEGGLLWGLSWRLTTGLAYRLRNGCAYAPVMRHEHINSAPEILAVLGWFFQDVQVKRFPLPWFHGSIYHSIHCRRPRPELSAPAVRIEP